MMPIMKTTAPAPVLAFRRAPQTLTLDMDLPPPAPARRTRPRKASVPQPPLADAPAAVLATASPPARAKPQAAVLPKPQAAVLPKPAAKQTDAKKTNAQALAPPAAKLQAVGKAKPAVPAPPAVRLERELALEGGTLWRMSGRHAVAYVQNASLACALLAVETRHLARRAMAVYYDKKGRAIAWQVRFDTQHWDDVLRRLGE